MEKINLAAAKILETRKLDEILEPNERANELRYLSDVELTLAGGGDDPIHW